jgi:hypothetical protein
MPLRNLLHPHPLSWKGKVTSFKRRLKKECFIVANREGVVDDGGGVKLRGEDTA